MVSVTSGVLFSYASIIFLEFHFRDSKEPREIETHLIKGSRKQCNLQFHLSYQYHFGGVMLYSVRSLKVKSNNNSPRQPAINKSSKSIYHDWPKVRKSCLRNFLWMPLRARHVKGITSCGFFKDTEILTKKPPKPHKNNNTKKRSGQATERYWQEQKGREEGRADLSNIRHGRCYTKT